MEIGSNKATVIPSVKPWAAVQSYTNKTLPLDFQDLTLHQVAHKTLWVSMSFTPPFILIAVA